MRKLTLMAVAAVTTLCVVPIAHAVTPSTAMKVSVSPSKKGTKSKPKNVKLNVELITQPKAGEPAFATRSTVLHFDKNLTFGGKYAKSCSASQVQIDETKCPKGSKVGSGSATGLALGLTENLSVTAYNGPHGSALELLVHGTAPLQIHSVIEGRLQKDSGRYGQKLVVPIPAALQEPVSGAFATLTDFKTSVKGTGSNNRPYAGLHGCTTNALNFKSDFVFTDGTTSSASTIAKCG
jgi:hypothetical protein